MTKSKFLWDRLRSIRQDLNLQQITDSFAVTLLEQMVRYTILAEHELCEETASATNPDGHNSHLNVEQLTKTLTSLRHMYDDHADRVTATERWATRRRKCTVINFYFASIHTDDTPCNVRKC